MRFLPISHSFRRLVAFQKRYRINTKSQCIVQLESGPIPAIQYRNSCSWYGRNRDSAVIALGVGQSRT
jgi:hypothetical protein